MVSNIIIYRIKCTIVVLLYGLSFIILGAKYLQCVKGIERKGEVEIGLTLALPTHIFVHAHFDLSFLVHVRYGK